MDAIDSVDVKSTHPRPHETDETTSTGAPSTSGIRGTDRGCAQPACRPRAPFGYDAGVLFSRPVVCTVSDAAVQVSPVPECPRTAEELGLNVELDRQVSGPAAGARGAWGTRPAGEGRRASSSPPRALRLDHGLVFEVMKRVLLFKPEEVCFIRNLSNGLLKSP
ncbi:hypothetical protein HPB47_027164 [Ixodes persulcatus]|uniref:Uncharacterized protein n=1 Tax=Ixodes persulcatus TaxID=34615 RepID=A0AC60PYB8_IXOPE|nr:hypothetical protein HPB47_027164 [Ixodes persulcatus]